jgi:divinyl chlorophyllide a 8-vinyl-reductase
MNSSKRIFVIGATGTIGRATVQALVRQGHDVVCFIRARAEKKISSQAEVFFEGASIRYGEVSDPQSIKEQGFKGEKFDVLVSCLASPLLEFSFNLLSYTLNKMSFSLNVVLKVLAI